MALPVFCSRTASCILPSPRQERAIALIPLRSIGHQAVEDAVGIGTGADPHQEARRVHAPALRTYGRARRSSGGMSMVPSGWLASSALARQHRA